MYHTHFEFVSSFSIVYNDWLNIMVFISIMFILINLEKNLTNIIRRAAYFLE
jgi:hypothetical protein